MVKMSPLLQPLALAARLLHLLPLPRLHLLLLLLLRLLRPRLRLLLLLRLLRPRLRLHLLPKLLQRRQPLARVCLRHRSPSVLRKKLALMFRASPAPDRMVVLLNAT